jgi:hypothetical protein
MTEQEVIYYFSQLFGAYVIGWSSGFLIYFIRKLGNYI